VVPEARVSSASGEDRAIDAIAGVKMAGWRSFFAIELSAEIAGGVRRIQGALRERAPGVRWVRPEGIHLTLTFLGEVEPDRIETIMHKAEETIHNLGSFAVEIRGCGGFPTAQNPRVIWIGVEDPSGRLTQMQARVATGMAALGFIEERRGYTPHLTVGRVRSGKGRKTLSQALDEIKGSDLGEMEVREVILFRSHLKPTGAEYTKLGSFPLEAAP
jgi:2'-5' RNA ligase